VTDSSGNTNVFNGLVERSGGYWVEDIPLGTCPNLVVTWQSVTNITYFLQRSSSLAPGSFQPLATNLPGWAGVTTYIDTNAPAPGPWYYRVGVP
jgi:hypothetical protein